MKDSDIDAILAKHQPEAYIESSKIDGSKHLKWVAKDWENCRFSSTYEYGFLYSAAQIRKIIREELSNEWLPIETAPKAHGQRILLWRDCGEGTLGSVTTGYWLDGSTDWHSDELMTMRTLKSYGYRATHWMPLPQPPKPE